MPFINLPPVVSEMFWDLDRRIRSLETAFRFNMPNVNFNTNIPTNPRVGDLYYDTYASQVTYWNGTEWVVIGDDNLGVPVIQWTSTWAGTGLAYTGTPAIGRSSRSGTSGSLGGVGAQGLIIVTYTPSSSFLTMF